MIFDAAVLAELKRLCAGLPQEPPEPASLGSWSPAKIRFHLLRSLEVPPADPAEGAGLLEELARQLAVSTGRLMFALERRDGEPRRTWRLAVGQRATQRLRWLLMREGGFIAIGRDELGDLSSVPPTAEGKMQIRTRLAQAPSGASRAPREAALFFSFVHEMSPGDRVVAVDGTRAVGIGEILGPYGFVNDRSLAHRRPVRWLSFEEVDLPPVEQREPLLDLSLHDPFLLAVEAALLRARVLPQAAQPPASDAPPRAPLDPRIAALHAALLRKGQVVLAGPPGTGKSYWAERAALELASRSWFGVGLDRLGDDPRRQLQEAGEHGLGALEICCFHPSFGYEDFVEGLRPQVLQGQLVFERRDGLFKRLCRRASLNPARDFFLVIDELNRADVARVFGDLLALLDRERRGHGVTLPLSGERLAVPPNVFVLATMNSADRSTTPLDAALRRRFAFFELEPEPEALRGARAGRVDLEKLLAAINERIRQQPPRAGLDARVGHALLMQRGRPVDSMEVLYSVLSQEILPTLLDHCLGDEGALAGLVGRGLVGWWRGGAREEGLEGALLGSFPEAEAGR